MKCSKKKQNVCVISGQAVTVSFFKNMIYIYVGYRKEKKSAFWYVVDVRLLGKKLNLW